MYFYSLLACAVDSHLPPPHVENDLDLTSLILIANILFCKEKIHSLFSENSAELGEKQRKKIYF